MIFYLLLDSYKFLYFKFNSIHTFSKHLCLYLHRKIFNMNSDIKELKIDSGRWIKNGVISLITVVLVLLLFKGKSLLIPTTLVITGIFISIICFISLLFYTLKYRHDKYIKIEIENNSIIRYYEKNQCLYTSDI